MTAKPDLPDALKGRTSRAMSDEQFRERLHEALRAAIVTMKPSIYSKVDNVIRREIKRAVGYVRVSTADQADSGAGLLAQRAAIAAHAKNRGWDLVEILEDRTMGRRHRHVLSYARRWSPSGEATRARWSSPR